MIYQKINTQIAEYGLSRAHLIKKTDDHIKIIISKGTSKIEWIQSKI